MQRSPQGILILIPLLISNHFAQAAFQTDDPVGGGNPCIGIFLKLPRRGIANLEEQCQPGSYLRITWAVCAMQILLWQVWGRPALHAAGWATL